jgi:glutamate synthase domain-containing protein 3
MTNGRSITIDADGMHYTPLNKRIREAVANGAEEIVLEHVLGQRFIANGLRGNASITINGIPGGDLGMFMSGPTCIVHGNCDHAPGNTMDGGRIVIHGSAGDAVAHSMRGGEIYVRDDIGYRGGIHMKEYKDKRPVLVVGGCARAFLGEYMAGGLLIVLGIGKDRAIEERGIGSGIHGGEIVVRGDVDDWLLGVGATKRVCTPADIERVRPYIEEFARLFDMEPGTLMEEGFYRIGPASARPFANKYTWE